MSQISPALRVQPAAVRILSFSAPVSSPAACVLTMFAFFE